MIDPHGLIRTREDRRGYDALHVAMG